MGIFESMGNMFSEKAPSPEERIHAAKKKALDELIATRNAIMANQAAGFGKQGESRIDTRELTSINDRIKEMQAELGEGDTDTEENPPAQDEKTIH